MQAAEAKAMAKITEIKQQVKRADRFSIYVDGKYSFSLSQEELAKSGLHKDQELSAQELKQIHKTAVLDKAKDRVMRYISIRPRSQWEIEDYLKRKGYNPRVTRTVRVTLKRAGLIDDLAFARQWVEWRINFKNRSKRQIKSELFKKRISRDIIDEVLAEVGDDTELDQIKQVIERKSKLSQYADKQKLIAYLARQGFPYPLIKKALNTEEN